MTAHRDEMLINEIKAVAAVADVDFWNIEQEPKADVRRIVWKFARMF